MSSTDYIVPVGSEANVQPALGSSDQDIDNKDKTEMALYLANLAAFLIALGICIASITIPRLQKAAPFGLSLWQWTLLITVLLCGPLLSKLFQYLVDCLANNTEYNMTDNIIFYVVELASKAWVVLWFSLILVAWFWVVHQPSYLKIPVHNDRLKIKYTKIFQAITTTLTTILIGSFLWLVKDGILTTKKASFHIKRFFERGYRALIHQNLINQLLEPNKNDEGMCGFMNCNRGKCCEEKMPTSLFGEKGVKVTKKNVSHLGMQKVNRWLLNNPSLTYYDSKQNKYIKIVSEKQACEVTDLIFQDVLPPKNIKGALEDNTKFFGDMAKDEASELMYRMADPDDTKSVDKKNFQDLMVKMFHYRETLGLSLNGNMELFRSVNSVINGLLILFIFALWLIMLRVETRNIIFVIASAIAGSAFLIGDTCSKLLNCWFLIFVVHPYDIGDCCQINDTPVTIKSIGILATKGKTLDNELKYYSNSKLFEDLPIINYTRSDDLGEFVEFSPGDVTKQQTEDIEKAIESRIKAAEHWDDHDYRFEKELIEGQIKMKLHLKHTIKFHGFKEKQRRKSELVQEIREIIKGNNKISDKAQPTEEEKKNAITGSSNNTSQSK